MDYKFYTQLPQLPDWLEEHIYNIIKESDSNPISYNDEFKDRMVDEAEGWIGKGDEELAELTKLDYNEEDTLGLHFSNVEAYKTYTETLARFDFLPVDEVVNEWVKENIQPLIEETVVGVNLQVMHGGTIITPHVDELRHLALNYQLETGGDNVVTTFFDPLPEYAHLKAYPRTLIPYDRLARINETVIPAKAWVALDVMNKIHAVENIDVARRRIALSVSLMK